MRKYAKIILAIMVFLSLLFIDQKAFATNNGTTTKETVRVREKASTDSKTVVLLSIDKQVQVISEQGDWYKISYTEDGKTYTGYVRNDMLKVDGKENNSEKETKKEENKEENQEQNENQNQEQENSVAEEQNATNTEATEQTQTQNEEQNKDENQVTKNSKIKLNNDIQINILPLITSSQIGTINKDTEITVLEVIGNWCHISANEQEGWVISSKVTGNSENSENENNQEEQTQENNEEQAQEESKQEEKKETTSKMYVNQTTVNIREKANTKSKVLKQLGINTEVTVIENTDNTWSKVKVDGIEGYINTKFLSEKKAEASDTTKKASSSRGTDESRTAKSDKDEEDTVKSEKEDDSSDERTSSNSSSGEAVVSYAKQFLGSKYVRGGSSPKGFDCSGYTQYIYKHFGYSISRTSGAQRGNGKGVSKSNLQAGDILCFKGHVGIYIGGNKFIHAENPSSGVTISSLSEKYYTKNYVTARRIID